MGCTLQNGRKAKTKKAKAAEKPGAGLAKVTAKVG